LIPVDENPVDKAWPEDERPQDSKEELEIHDIEFAGKKVLCSKHI